MINEQEDMFMDLSEDLSEMEDLHQVNTEDFDASFNPIDLYPGGCDLSNAGNLIQSLVLDDLLSDEFDNIEDGMVVGQVVSHNINPVDIDNGLFGTSTESEMQDVLGELALEVDDFSLAVEWDLPKVTSEVDSIIGTPDLDSNYWQPQTTDFTCAIQAQRGIIEAFTGNPISEAELVYDAYANGWISKQGMMPEDVGKLLELNGIECHVANNANTESLIWELAQGHKVIVGVDSGELLNVDSPLEDFYEQAADHAIWVTGVNMTDPNNPKVIINDSGTEDGAGREYELNDFVDAWADSGFYYVATDNAPPDLWILTQDFDPANSYFPELTGWLRDYSDVQTDTGTSAGLENDEITKETNFDTTEAISESVFTMLDAAGQDALMRMI